MHGVKSAIRQIVNTEVKIKQMYNKKTQIIVIIVFSYGNKLEIVWVMGNNLKLKRVLIDDIVVRNTHVIRHYNKSINRVLSFVEEKSAIFDRTSPLRIKGELRWHQSLNMKKMFLFLTAKALETKGEVELLENFKQKYKLLSKISKQ